MLEKFLRPLPIALAALFAAANASNAQETAPKEGLAEMILKQGDKLIVQEEWRELIDGKTLYYHTAEGIFVGREYFPKGADHAIFVHDTGECFRGEWWYEAQRFCFHYHATPSCWTTFWRDGQVTIVSDGGEMQMITKFAESEPLSCAPPAISQAFPTKETNQGAEG